MKYMNQSIMLRVVDFYVHVPLVEVRPKNIHQHLGKVCPVHGRTSGSARISHSPRRSDAVRYHKVVQYLALTCSCAHRVFKLLLHTSVQNEQSYHVEKLGVALDNGVPSGRNTSSHLHLSTCDRPVQLPIVM